MSAVHPLAGRAAILTRAAWIPVPILAAAMLVLWAANLPGSYFAPRLVFFLQFVFMTLASTLVIYLASRSVLASGSVGLLLLDCGVVFWGLSGVVAGAVSRGDVNVSVTVHNLCVFISALCHAIGVVHEPRRALRNRGWCLLAMFTFALVAITTIVHAAIAGWLPTFFLQGQGGTPLRQVVLGAAVAMFVFSALVLRAKSRPDSSPFARWYYLGLLLMATGLIGVLIQTAHSSVLGWLGVATQWLSGPYLVIAALAAARESNAWEIPLAATPSDVRLRYGMAALLVVAAAIVQLVFVPESAARIVYVTFFPAVMLAAVYGGRGPGILAAVLSTIIIDVYWVEPLGRFDVQDLVGVTFFLGTSVAVVLTVAAMQKAQARAVAAWGKLALAAARGRSAPAQRGKVFDHVREGASPGCPHAPAGRGDRERQRRVPHAVRFFRARRARTDRRVARLGPRSASPRALPRGGRGPRFPARDRNDGHEQGRPPADVVERPDAHRGRRQEARAGDGDRHHGEEASRGSVACGARRAGHSHGSTGAIGRAADGEAERVRRRPRGILVQHHPRHARSAPCHARLRSGAGGGMRPPEPGGRRLRAADQHGRRAHGSADSGRVQLRPADARGPAAHPDGSGGAAPRHDRDIPGFSAAERLHTDGGAAAARAGQRSRPHPMLVESAGQCREVRGTGRDSAGSRVGRAERRTRPPPVPGQRHRHEQGRAPDPVPHLRAPGHRLRGNWSRPRHREEGRRADGRARGIRVRIGPRQHVLGRAGRGEPG